MKKQILILFIILTCCNIFAYCNKVINVNKSKDKQITVVVVGESQVKDTINAMEQKGWTFNGIEYNKNDATWTIVFYRYTKIKDVVIHNSGEPLNGVTTIYRYNRECKKVAKFIYTFKDNELVDRQEVPLTAADNDE